MKSHLNEKSLFLAVSTWRVAIIRYSSSNIIEGIKAVFYTHKKHKKDKTSKK